MTLTCGSPAGSASPPPVEHHVGGLQVPVHQAARLGRPERPGDLRGDFQSERDGQRTVAAHALLQRLALDELHRVERLSVRLAHAVLEDAGDVGMAQRRRPFCLAQEAGACARADRGGGVDDLQRHGPVEHRVARQVGRAHRAAAEFARGAIGVVLQREVTEPFAPGGEFGRAGLCGLALVQPVGEQADQTSEVRRGGGEGTAAARANHRRPGAVRGVGRGRQGLVVVGGGHRRQRIGTNPRFTAARSTPARGGAVRPAPRFRPPRCRPPPHAGRRGSVPAAGGCACAAC